MLIKNGSVVTLQGIEKLDIRVLDGRIAEIGEHLTAQAEEPFPSLPNC